MKALTVVFWAAVAGVAVSFAGAIVHVVQNQQAKVNAPAPIATPATVQNQ